MLKKPKIIIFDDSTSAVDTRTDALIRETLKKYAPLTTKIVIAQRVSSVQEADRIVVMDQGKIVCVGNHTELLKVCEIYRDLYESQSGEKGERADENKVSRTANTYAFLMGPVNGNLSYIQYILVAAVGVLIILSGSEAGLLSVYCKVQ